MKLGAVTAKISSAYNKFFGHRATHTTMERVQAEYVQRQNILQQKRNAVYTYLTNNTEKSVKTDFKPDYFYVRNNNVNDIIAQCNGNLAKIEGLLGRYGLACYGELPIEEVTDTSSHLVEVPYKKYEPAVTSIYNYMLSNPNGKLNDLYARFGKCGEVALNHCIEKGYAQKTNLTYSVPFEKEEEMAMLVTVRHTSDAITHLIHDV